MTMNDSPKIDSCRSCGRFYDTESGFMADAMSGTVIVKEDRGSELCRACYLLQGAPDPMREFWPGR